MAEIKPPLGVMPADIYAWRRIEDLAQAIARQAQASGRTSYVRKWAREILAQCGIVDDFGRDHFEKALDSLRSYAYRRANDDQGADGREDHANKDGN